jgi:hypothetical protein
MAPTRTGLAVTLILVAACAGPNPASPRATLPTSPTPTPEPSPAVATVPPLRVTPAPPGTPKEESMPTSSSVERHGIKLTIRLGSNPMNAGNGNTASVTIKNTGRRVLSWTNDGCDTNAGVLATMAQGWRDSSLDVSPELEPFREWLREEAGAVEPIRLRFLPPHFLRYRSFGCADLGIPRELAPGREVTQEFTWDGFAGRRLGLPPTGPTTLTTRFERWSRPGPGSDGTPIEVTLDSWVLRGRPEEYLSPAEAIDAALADDRLASWIVTNPLKSSADAIAEYDRDLGVWAVGLLMYRDDGGPILHAAFLDPITGEVIAIREHRVTF